MQAHICRVEDPNNIIIQLPNKGVKSLKLKTPIKLQHMAMARQVSCFNPVPATVKLGPYNPVLFMFEESEIVQVDWPEQENKPVRKRWF